MVRHISWIGQIEMSEKKKIGGSKSRKAAWRRIDHSEIEDTASLDVTQTLVNRLINRSKRSRPDEEDNFFRLDASGSKNNLSRSIRKDIDKHGKGVAQLSEHHIKAIEKTQIGLPQREKSLKKQAEVLPIL